MNAAREAVRMMSLDDIVPAYSAYISLRDLVEDSLRTGYVPTIQCGLYNETNEELHRAAR